MYTDFLKKHKIQSSSQWLEAKPFVVFTISANSH